jgi:ribosomal protein L12E/L44/L45/RPP1/RPP2
MQDDRMMTVSDSAGVEATHLRIAELVQQLYSRSDADSDTVIAELAEHAAIEIPGAKYAGVTVTRNAKQIDTPAATHKWPILLDEIQQRHREGPCLTAAWEERTWKPTSGSRSTAEMRWSRHLFGRSWPSRCSSPAKPWEH